MLPTKIHLSPSELWTIIGKEFVLYVNLNVGLRNKVLGLKNAEVNLTSDVIKGIRNWLNCDFSCSTTSQHKFAEQNIDILLEPDLMKQDLPQSRHIKGRMYPPSVDPQIILTEGTLEDWKTLSRKIGKLLVYSHGNSALIKWYTSLSRIIKNILEFHETGKIKPDFWKTMFQITTNPLTWELEFSGWGTLFSSVEPKKIPMVQLDVPDLDPNPWSSIHSPIESALQREISTSTKMNPSLEVSNMTELGETTPLLENDDFPDTDFCIV